MELENKYILLLKYLKKNALDFHDPEKKVNAYDLSKPQNVKYHDDLSFI